MSVVNVNLTTVNFFVENIDYSFRIPINVSFTEVGIFSFVFCIFYNIFERVYPTLWVMLLFAKVELSANTYAVSSFTGGARCVGTRCVYNLVDSSTAIFKHVLQIACTSGWVM